MSKANIEGTKWDYLPHILIMVGWPQSVVPMINCMPCWDYMIGYSHSSPETGSKERQGKMLGPHSLIKGHPPNIIKAGTTPTNSTSPVEPCEGRSLQHWLWNTFAEIITAWEFRPQAYKNIWILEIVKCQATVSPRQRVWNSSSSCPFSIPQKEKESPVRV